MSEVDASFLRVLDDDGRADPERDPRLGPEGLMRLYRELVRARRLDERLLALARQGRVGFHGSAIGQEAVPVGATLALASEDWIFPALREGAALLVRGFPIELYLAQAFGSARDRAKGRQMPSHAAAREVRCVSWSSAIATQLPQAVGMGIAARSRGDSAIALAFMGDGATSHPDFHAALNFAGVFRAPVVFVCVNNQYALSLPASRQSASSSFGVKARAYGLPGVRVDGNDALAVYTAVAEAASRARAGDGATLLECVTYRVGAHSTSDDPTRYRSATEERAWLGRDPLLRLARHLEREGVLGASRAAELQAAVELEIDRALALAEGVRAPARNTLFDDVYAVPPRHLAEQASALARAH